MAKLTKEHLLDAVNQLRIYAGEHGGGEGSGGGGAPEKVYSTIVNNVSVTANINNTLATIDLKKGTYIITAFCNYQGDVLRWYQSITGGARTINSSSYDSEGHVAPLVTTVYEVPQDSTIKYQIWPSKSVTFGNVIIQAIPIIHSSNVTEGVLKPWLYNTNGEESIVGVYNGKPLYQKIFTSTITTIGNISIGDISDIPFEHIFIKDSVMIGNNAWIKTGYKGISEDTVDISFSTYIRSTDNTIRAVVAPSDFIGREVQTTIQYTKTTDAEGSGNNLTPFIGVPLALKQKVLFSGGEDITEGVIELNDSIENYDIIFVNTYIKDSNHPTEHVGGYDFTILTSSAQYAEGLEKYLHTDVHHISDKTNDFICSTFGFCFNDETHLEIVTNLYHTSVPVWTHRYIYEIIGLRIESTDGSGGAAPSAEMTWAEYEALTEEEKMDGTERFIIDANETDTNIYNNLEERLAHLEYLLGNMVTEYKRTGCLLMLDALNNCGGPTIIHSNNASYWADISANALGNVCQVINGQWHDKYLYLNGTDAWVKCTRRTPELMTVETLCKFTSIPEGEETYVVCNAQTGGFLFGVDDDGLYFLQIYVNGSYHLSKNRKAVAGELVHLVGTYDGSVIKVYVNGELTSETFVSGVIGSPSSGVPISIGSNPDSSGIGSGLMTGEVYTVRLYDHALTQEEIVNHYNLDKQRYDIR